jgi:hypothetical protein
MRRPFAIVVACALVLAGCDGSDENDSASPEARGCSVLTADDVARVAGRTPFRRDLAPEQAARTRCSTAFFAGGSELVVSITEHTGTRALQRLRAAQLAEHGAASVRPVPSLGKGAFVADKRILAFRRGESVVVLETGFSGRRRILTVAQLERLARLAAERL